VDYVDPRRPLNWMLALAQNCASKSNNRTLNALQPFDLVGGTMKEVVS
jgi:hypothetical protein